MFNSKYSIVAIMLIFISIHAKGQSIVDGLIGQGVEYHDKGEYDKAIEYYQKALKIDNKSSLANYEIAFSYYEKKDYIDAIKYADKVIDQGDDNAIEAYIIKGSALDMLGMTQESIDLFKNAIATYKEEYLLYYNLAVNYSKVNDYKNTEYYAIKALERNPNHPSSHFLLANIHGEMNNTVKSQLALYYFLLLEPNSYRSLEAIQTIKNNRYRNVSKDNQNNRIEISLSSDTVDEFRGIELMMVMEEALNYAKENEEKLVFDIFMHRTKSFFNFFKEVNKKDKESIWWKLYIPFFINIVKSDHLETYCRYITQAKNEDNIKWLKENKDKVNALEEWLKK